MIDSYSTRARMFPVYVTISPVILAIAALVPKGLDLPLAGAAAIVLVPLSFLASQVGADFGKRLEKDLWLKWGGPPTTRFSPAAGMTNIALLLGNEYMKS